MIQRKQSLFMLLSGVVYVLGIFFAIFTIDFGDKSLEIFPGKIIYPVGEGLFSDNPGLWVLWLCIILAVGNVFAIFLFRNRSLQIRILRIINIATVFIVGGGAYYIPQVIKLADLGGDYLVKPGLSAFLPVVAIVLNVMAIKSIRKDEDLIKSVDRLR